MWIRARLRYWERRTLEWTFLGDGRQFQFYLLLLNRADAGKKIISCAGLAMLILLLSGVYVWWPNTRVAIQREQDEAAHAVRHS